MPSFAPSGQVAVSGELPKPVHCVARGNYGSDPFADPFLRCTGYALVQGGAGCQLQLEAPVLHWDEHFGELKDATIAVWWARSAAEGVSDADPDVLAYINVDSAKHNKSTSTVSFTATSVAPRLKKVPVGPMVGTNCLEFKNRVKGSSTAIGNYTPSKVLRILFDSDHLSSFWRLRVRLGDIGVLDDMWDASNAPDFVFTNTNLLSAIEQIISHCGDVYFTERFSSSMWTYLDFHRVSQPDAGYSNIVVCQRGQSAIDIGANAEDIEFSGNTDECYTRVWGVGDHKRPMITVATNSPTAPLQKLWDRSGGIVYTDPDTATTYTAEQLVLHDANLAKGEQTPASYTSLGSDIQDVFKKYALPPEVMKYNIAESNALKNSLGQRMKVQVIKVPLILSEGDGDPYFAVGAVVPGRYEEVKSVDLHLAEGYFITGEPMINVKGIKAGPDGSLVHEYEEAVVGITITPELPPVMHDTGQGGTLTGDLAYPWSADGEGMIVACERYEYSQLTSKGLSDFLPEYNCTYRHPDTGEWHHVTTQTVLQDDSAKLRVYTRSILREKAKRDRPYSVLVPWMTRAFPLGTKVLVQGQRNFVYDTYAIAGAVFDLKTNRTRLQFHTVRPPHVQEDAL